MNLEEYFKNNNIKYTIADNKVIKFKIIDKSTQLPYNNKTIYGNCIKKNLTPNVSISKPKFWPEKGYYEINHFFEK